VVVHGFELGDEAAFAGGAVATLVEVVATEVVVGLAGVLATAPVSRTREAMPGRSSADWSCAR
jgi:hypothetical protein